MIGYPTVSDVAPSRRPCVFIAHPSDLLTDHVPNGDGLVAYGFIRELAARGYRLHVAARQVALREALPANVVLHSIPIRPSSALLDRLLAMRDIRQLLARLRRQERIDLVHQMNPVFVGMSLSLMGSRLPLVLGPYVARWPHGEVAEEHRGAASRALRAAARWGITLAQQSQAAALLVTTPAALNRLALPGLAQRRIVPIQHGLDTALFSPGPDTAPADASILFYAHLDRRKGVLVLLNAFDIAAHEHPSCTLTLVGRGEHVAEVRARIAASPHASRITLRGPVPREDAPALFRSHAVYCLPSFSEPYGMTALEAMACGRPVVSTAAGGLAHLVPLEGGVQVPPGDVAALAQALLQVLRDPAARRAMGRANRAHAEQHHDWRRVTDQLEAVYARLLSHS